MNALREAASDLPFQELGEVIDLSGEQCNFNERHPDDPLRWLLIQAEAKVNLPLGADEASTRRYRIPPMRLIAFTTWPGESK